MYLRDLWPWKGLRTGFKGEEFEGGQTAALNAGRNSLTGSKRALPNGPALPNIAF